MAVRKRIAALGLMVALVVPSCGTAPPSVAGPAGDRATPSPTAGTLTPTTVPRTVPPSAPASPSSPSSTRAATATFDPALAEKLQADLDASVRLLEYPALAAAVILPDGSSWSGAAGMADLAKGVPATPRTSFAIASVSKTFVAALVLLLAEDGRLSLDDPIAKWLPGLADDGRFAARRVSVRQLLDHTSGIADYTASQAFLTVVTEDLARRWTPEEVLAFAGTPTSAPGTAWAYSNTNYTLAGMVIERAGGASLASLLHDRILAPLGLARTVLQPQELPASPAHGYSAIWPGGTAAKPADPWDGGGMTPSASMASSTWAAGGMASTPADLARWAAALYGGRVLDPASLAEMLDFKRNAGLPGGGEYGLGVMERFLDGGLTIGHAGGTAGFQSGMWYMTKRRVVLVILTNTDNVTLDLAYPSLERIVLDQPGV
ncbi:MAG: serine hydrolase domain-containing protein [Candidatus Limnocylindrales bacterium]